MGKEANSAPLTQLVRYPQDLKRQRVRPPPLFPPADQPRTGRRNPSKRPRRKERLVVAGVEQGGLKAQAGESRVVHLGDALHQSVEAQAAQAVAYAPGVDWGFGVAEQLRKQLAQLAITKALGLEADQNQPC